MRVNPASMSNAFKLFLKLKSLMFVEFMVIIRSKQDQLRVLCMNEHFIFRVEPIESISFFLDNRPGNVTLST